MSSALRTLPLELEDRSCQHGDMDSIPWERVYTINEYYDGPRLGIAGFEGKPHIYESQWNDVEDDYTDRFWIREIDSQLLALVMEDWEIYRRWSGAYKRGETTVHGHPALPSERQRHEELSMLIGDRLKAREERSVTKCARFRGAGEDGLEVQWLDPPDAII
jgi:hypothetical protein